MQAHIKKSLIILDHRGFVPCSILGSRALLLFFVFLRENGGLGMQKNVFVLLLLQKQNVTLGGQKGMHLLCLKVIGI